MCSSDLAVGEQSQEVFIGREWVANREHSEETARLVDAEVKRIIDAGMETADRLLRENIDALRRVAEALLERETLTGEETRKLLEGETLPPLDLKANPRKLITTKDLEKQAQEKNAEKGKKNPKQTRLNKTSNADNRDDDADLAPGYDLYGRPNTAEDTAEDEHKRSVEQELKKEGKAAPTGTAKKKPAGRSPLGSALSGEMPPDEQPDEQKDEPPVNKQAKPKQGKKASPDKQPDK